MDDDGRRNGNLTVMDDAGATRRQLDSEGWRWRWMNGESATAMLARLAVGATKANTASKHKM